MKKTLKDVLSFILCFVLCVTSAAVSVMACIADPNCPEEGCHTIDTEEGPLLHHGHQELINETEVIEEDDPDYCPGEYRTIIHWCTECGEYFTVLIEDPVLHALVTESITTGSGKVIIRTYCQLCGYVESSYVQ